MPLPGPHSKFERRFWAKEFANRKRLMEEFKALCSTVPINEAQTEWILKAIDDFRREHPELERQIESVLDEQAKSVGAKASAFKMKEQVDGHNRDKNIPKPSEDWDRERWE